MDETNRGRDHAKFEHLGHDEAVCSSIGEHRGTHPIDVDVDTTLLTKRSGKPADQFAAGLQTPGARHCRERGIQRPVTIDEVISRPASCLGATTPLDAGKNEIVDPCLVPRHALDPVGPACDDLRQLVERGSIEIPATVPHLARSITVSRSDTFNIPWTDPNPLELPWRPSAVAHSGSKVSTGRAHNTTPDR